MPQPSNRKPQRGPQPSSKAAPKPAPVAAAVPAAAAADDRAARRARQVKDRREQNARNRNQQRQQRYQQNKRELLIIKVVAGAIAVAVVAALGVGIWNWGRDRELNREPEGVVEVAYAGAQHREGDIAYPLESDYQGEVPPAGGVHNNAWYDCDVYDAPVRWENAVHALEHGAVWVSYRPDLPADDIEALRGIGGGDEVLIAPEPLLQAPVVLTAWGNRLTLDRYDEETVKRFVRFYQNNPEADAPEVAAGCAGSQTSPRTTEPATPTGDSPPATSATDTTSATSTPVPDVAPGAASPTSAAPASPSPATPSPTG